MKKRLFFLFYFISIVLFSQYKSGVIHFKNGATLNGQIKITKHHEIIFNENNSKKKFDHTKVNKIVFSDSIEHHYKKRKKTTLLLKKEVEGPLELYSLASYFSGFSDGSRSGMYIDHYLGEKGSDFVEIIPSNLEKKRFRKFIAKYTSKCKSLLEKIQDKKSLKSNFDSNIINIIKYNNNCID
ncbi:hypothetical protein [Tenacibaculum discolor]|uniref:hypothetical protein n=1 Tax=Tenacibaculum discolor TaxID=361581 RepID=UPI000F29D899|nr:hypothetical protein [Tenacibaculum discolor]RLK00361.1 hypothetical protein C8N27_2048 [Tenacibaculum discolor]